MDDALIQRVEALERAVTDGDHDLAALADEAEALDRLDRLEERYDGLETRIAELEAATQALRGYVGNVRAVNEEVETRAETALAKVESLEASVGRPDADAPPDASRTDMPTAGGSRTSRTENGSGEGGGFHEEGTHCSACGRARPGKSRDGIAGSRTDGTRRDGNGMEAWEGDSPEELRQDDPVVPDGTEDESGALGRFKRLL